MRTLAPLHNTVMSVAVTAAELQRVLVIFNKLDIFQTEQVDFSEILAHVDFIKNSPFGERMLEVYDLDCSRKLMLKEFAMLCSIFVPSCPREKKLKFLFDLYDLDNDGGLSTEDVFDSIKKMTGGRLQSEDMDTIVKHTFKEADVDLNHKITFNEFLKVHSGSDMAEKMTFSF